MVSYSWLSVGFLMLWMVEYARNQEYCLATDNSPYLFFGSRTAYEFVYEKRITHQSVPGCQPVQMWMLGKYGTSYPSWERLKAMSDMTSLRDQIIHNHESRRNGEMCYIDRDALKDWKWDVDMDQAGRLSNQGRLDMKFLAKRLKTNFPSVLDLRHTADRFTFKFSDLEASRASAQEFAQELFSRPSPVYFSEINVESRLSGSNCSTLNEAETTSKLAFEIEKFRQGNLANNLIVSVSRRLGYLYNLTLETVLDIYDVCRYEKAWDYSKTSPWCAAFTKKDLMALEYFEDMKHFYQNGYGNDLSLRYGCPLVKDLMDNFQRVANDEVDVPAAVFYFADEVLLESVMSRLGMANDKRQLPASLNSLNGVEKRQWRTAFISPFAGNIAAVFYKCSTGESNKVMFFINEHTVEYEGCQVGLCSWQYLKERFSPIIAKSCNYNFCDSLTDSASSLAITTSTVLLIAFILQLQIFL